jgi:NitT/TauT family transport system substrate-binding protein
LAPADHNLEVHMATSRSLSARAALVLAAVAGVLISACTAAATPSAAPVKLTVGLGYIPNIQFAPFYLAQREGLYTKAGLDVTLQNGNDADLIPLTGAGTLDVSLADGTSVVPAVAQGIPIQYVATIYGQFPNIVLAKEAAGIKGPADLKGKKLGTPGRYGSSWVMLQAMLDSVGLKPTDLTITEYPDYGQATALAKGAVEVATGFANNEPVQLRLAGEKVSVLHVDQIIPLPGPGMIVGKPAMDNATKKAAIKAFVAATLAAMKEIVATPSKGVDAAIAVVPDLASSRATQEAILAATIEVWRSPLTDSKGLGALDEAGWTKSIAYLTKLGLVAKPVVVGDVVRTDLLP